MNNNPEDNLENAFDLDSISDVDLEKNLDDDNANQNPDGYLYQRFDDSLKDDNSFKKVRYYAGKAVILPIRFYQIYISPAAPGKCRFTPTCSHYYVQAVEKYGPIKGSYLGIRRILKCHPFHEGGYDPVP